MFVRSLMIRIVPLKIGLENDPQCLSDPQCGVGRDDPQGMDLVGNTMIRIATHENSFGMLRMFGILTRIGPSQKSKPNQK